LIKKSGYVLDQQDVVSFLADFLPLNPGIKSISFFRKGTVLKIPLKVLKKDKKISTVERVSTERQQKRKKPVKKEEKEVRTRTEIRKEKAYRRSRSIKKSEVINNIKILSDFLDSEILLETEGFKVFDINDASELALDTSYFPVIKVSEQRAVVLDYMGILPEEIKEIVELAWPEYRVVRNGGRLDLKDVVDALLSEMGYNIQRDKKIIIGGSTQIEYMSDFLIFRKNDELLNVEIVLIGIIDRSGYASPEILRKWLKERDIKLLELAPLDREIDYTGRAKSILIDPDKDSREFTETVLSLLGVDFLKDNVIRLSGRKEYSYNLRADLSIKLGNKIKIIEFAELSPYEMRYARKRGFDIASIGKGDSRESIISKITNLLSLDYKNSPLLNSAYLTPDQVKYRLRSPGIIVNSKKGPLFFTDSYLSSRMLEHLVSDKYTIIVF
jgi:hypothetical protein